MDDLSVDSDIAIQAHHGTVEGQGFDSAVNDIANDVVETVVAAAEQAVKTFADATSRAIGSFGVATSGGSSCTGETADAQRSSTDADAALRADDTGIRDNAIAACTEDKSTKGAAGPGYGWEPGSNISPERRAELGQQAEKLFDHYLNNPNDPRAKDSEKVTYTEYGSMLKNLQEDKYLNDNEKFYVMNKFTEKAMTNWGRDHVSNTGARPDVLDDFWLQRDSSAAHAMISTTDVWFKDAFEGKTDNQVWDFLAERERNDVISNLPEGPVREAGRGIMTVITDGDAFNVGDFNAHFRLYAYAAKPGLMDKLDFNAYAEGWRKAFLENPN